MRDDDRSTPLILGARPLGIGHRGSGPAPDTAVVLAAGGGRLAEAAHRPTLLDAARYRYRYQVDTTEHVVTWEDYLPCATAGVCFGATMTARWHVSDPLEVVRENIATLADAAALIRTTLRALVAHHVRVFAIGRDEEAEARVHAAVFDRPRLLPGGITADAVTVRLRIGGPTREPDPSTVEAEQQRLRWERLVLAGDRDRIAAQRAAAWRRAVTAARQRGLNTAPGDRAHPPETPW